MFEEREEFDLQIQASGKNKITDASRILKNGNNLICKKGKKRNILMQRKKTGLGKKMKAKDKIHQQNSENVNLSVNYNNKDAYKCPLGWSNLILKYLPHNLALTQDELNILFTKYKWDGHFEENRNFRPPSSGLEENRNFRPSFSGLEENRNFRPPFSGLLNNRQNIMNDENYFSNKSNHPFDTQYLHYSSNKDTYENLYNNNVHENQQNFKHNVHRQQENHISEMCDVRNHAPRYSENIENIFPERNYSLQNESNNFPYNVQHENSQSISENSQQYDMQHIGQPWNSNMHYDFHMKEWNGNMFLTNVNDDYQLWRNQQSNYIPETSNSEWQYGAKILPEQNNLNTYSSNVNPYNLINNQNSDYTILTNQDYHEEQHVHTSTSPSLLSSFTNIINDYV